MRIGVEIEAENVDEPFEIEKGVYESDGSLRNNGIEYISNILPSVQAAKEWHCDVISKLDDVGAVYSQRCGVHIHMDFSRNMDNVKQFLRNYLTVERYIVSLLPELRRKSTFCLPLLDYDGDFYPLKQFLLNSSTFLLNECSKYSALNLRPLGYQGSIEFGMLPTMSDTTLFNTVIDILEDCFNTSDVVDIKEKYGISDIDFMEAEAYYKNLTRINRQSDGDYLSDHFDVPRQQQPSGGITEEMLEQYLAEVS